jgi:uncharacterized protein YjbJ (UPF0337 family)
VANYDQQIKWSSLKPKILKHWAKISENDLSQLNGNKEELVSILRKRYGYGRAQAEIEINKWLADQEIQNIG